MDGSGSRFSLVRRIALDIEPLRVSRDFRLIWGGLFISELGYQFTLVAVYVQVYAITRSPAAVGLVGLFSFVALLFGSIVSGAMIDAYDRRRLMLAAQVGFAVGSGILLAGAIAGHPPVWLIYLATAILAGVSTIDAPTRSTRPGSGPWPKAGDRDPPAAASSRNGWARRSWRPRRGSRWRGR